MYQRTLDGTEKASGPSSALSHLPPVSPIALLQLVRHFQPRYGSMTVKESKIADLTEPLILASSAVDGTKSADAHINTLPNSLTTTYPDATSTILFVPSLGRSNWKDLR